MKPQRGEPECAHIRSCWPDCCAWRPCHTVRNLPHQRRRRQHGAPRLHRPVFDVRIARIAAAFPSGAGRRQAGAGPRRWHRGRAQLLRQDQCQSRRADEKTLSGQIVHAGDCGRRRGCRRACRWHRTGQPQAGADQPARRRFLWGAHSGALVEAIRSPRSARSRWSASTTGRARNMSSPRQRRRRAVYRELLKTTGREHRHLRLLRRRGATGKAVARLIQEESGCPARSALLRFLSRPSAATPRGSRRRSAATRSVTAPTRWSDAFPISRAPVPGPTGVPRQFPGVLARFPPTLLITGTRDFSMSSLLQSQRLLHQRRVSRPSCTSGTACGIRSSRIRNCPNRRKPMRSWRGSSTNTWASKRGIDGPG